MKLLLPLTILFVLVAGCNSSNRQPDIIVTRDPAIANAARANVVNKMVPVQRLPGADPESMPKRHELKTNETPPPAEAVTDRPTAAALSETSSSPPAVISVPVPPTPMLAPETDHGGVTARCRDGSPSYSTHRRGTCSHHGSVAEWY